jgi:uncharacterized protein (DUF433 family)
MPTTDAEAEATIDRFATPLYTVPEAASYLRVPVSTFATWATGYRRRAAGRHVRGEPVVTATGPRRRGQPVIPFVGLAEGLVLAALRRSGVPLQRIRPALDRLEQEIGLHHALATQRLFTDGAEVLFDYAEATEDAEAAAAVRQLVVVRSGQRVFNEVVAEYLHNLRFSADGYVDLIRLPAYVVAEVVADPTRGFGQPVFARGGARLEDALSMFKAGEDLATVAEEFGVPPEQLEDTLRVALVPAA